MMVKYTGPPKRKYTKKSDAPFSKTQVSAIAKIAKKVDLRLAETKSYLGTANFNPVSDLWYAQALSYPIAQGTAAENVIGEKMMFKNIRLRIGYTSGATLSGTPQIIRFAIVKAKQDFTTTRSLVTASDIVRAPTGATGYCDFYDDHKITVLSQFDRAVNPNHTSSGHTTHFEVSVPINKTEYNLQNNAGYLKNGNYYLLMFATDFTGINTTGTWFYSWTVDFKDM